MNHRRHRLGACFLAAVIGMTAVAFSLAPASTAEAVVKKTTKPPVKATAKAKAPVKKAPVKTTHRTTTRRPSVPARPALKRLARSPYVGAIVVEADSGKVL